MLHWFNKHLALRFILFITILMVVFVYFLEGVFLKLYKQGLDNSIRERSEVILDFIANVNTEAILEGNLSNIEDFLMTTMNTYKKIVYGVVYNRKGVPLTVAISKPKDIAHIIKFEKPIKLGDKTIGSVEVWLDQTEEMFALARYKRLSRGLALVFSLLLAVMFFATFLILITRPLRKICRSMEQVVKGERVKSKVCGRDEINRLGICFNNMIDNLTEHELELKRVHTELAEWNQRLEAKVKERTQSLEQAQDKLVQNEKMAAIGQMAAAVSHDLRNPLTGIKAALYHLKRRLNNPGAELDEVIKSIETEVEYCGNVISNILSFSKPIKLDLGLYDINKMIEDALAVFEFSISSQHIELEKQLNKRIRKVPLDERQIKQVFRNLLLNAVQALPTGGKLTVSSYADDDNVEIKIADSGVGIPPDELPKIFEPFFSTKARGVGLGLSIVRDIVSRHNGQIRVESELNKGAAFMVVFPLSQNKTDLA